MSPAVSASSPVRLQQTREVKFSSRKAVLAASKVGFRVLFSNGRRFFPKRSLKTVPPPQCPHWTQRKRLCKNEFEKTFLNTLVLIICTASLLTQKISAGSAADFLPFRLDLNLQRFGRLPQLVCPTSNFGREGEDALPFSVGRSENPFLPSS